MKLPAHILEFFRRTGKIGVQKRNAGLSAERRSEIARIAANTRWKNAESDPSEGQQNTRQRVQNKTGKKKKQK